MGGVIELTGWLGLILLSACLAKFSSKGKIDNQLMLFFKKNHKYFGWTALTALFLHGTLATTNLLIPVMGQSNRLSILAETSWGYLLWLMLLAICIASVMLSYKTFRRRHLQMVLILGVLLLIHIE
ncbi:hypothetical protein JCM14036_00960 [Desulfotomaculum defluvii]